MSDTIPPAILANIARAVDIICAWNTGIPREARYAACGGMPVLEPDDAVREWSPRRTAEQPVTPAPAGAPVPPQAAHTPRSSKGLGTPCPPWWTTCV